MKQLLPTLRTYFSNIARKFKNKSTETHKVLTISVILDSYKDYQSISRISAQMNELVPSHVWRNTKLLTATEFYG